MRRGVAGMGPGLPIEVDVGQRGVVEGGQPGGHRQPTQRADHSRSPLASQSLQQRTRVGRGVGVPGEAQRSQQHRGAAQVDGDQQHDPLGPAGQVSQRACRHAEHGDGREHQHGDGQAGGEQSSHLGGRRQRSGDQFSGSVPLFEQNGVRRIAGPLEERVGLGSRGHDRPGSHAQGQDRDQAEGLAPLAQAGRIEPFQASTGQQSPPQSRHHAPAARCREPGETGPVAERLKPGEVPAQAQGDGHQQQDSPESDTSVALPVGQSQHGESERDQADVAECLVGGGSPGNPGGRDPERVAVHECWGELTGEQVPGGC